MDAGLPDQGVVPGGEYDDASLWWQHEALHREVLRDYAVRLRAYAGERNALEGEFIRNADSCESASTDDRAWLSANCFTKAKEATGRWANQVRSLTMKTAPPMLARLAWSQFNHQAKFDRSH